MGRAWAPPLCLRGGQLLALQVTTTLAARWLPGVDAALPALPGLTSMMPGHWLLHLATASFASPSRSGHWRRTTLVRPAP